MQSNPHRVPFWRSYLIGALVYLLFGTILLMMMNWWMSQESPTNQVEPSTNRPRDESHADFSNRPQARTSAWQPPASTPHDRAASRADQRTDAGSSVVLSPTLRRIIWEELVRAERRAKARRSVEQDSTPLLRVGAEILLNDRLMLRPAYGNRYRKATEAGARIVEAGTLVEVEDIVQRAGTVWYGVIAWTAEHTYLGYGWVEQHELLSRTAHDHPAEQDWNRIRNIRREVYRHEIMVKYGLTEAMLSAIREESERESWPVPPAESASHNP
ncbi:MAG: hypothetical protein D6690_02370 [Nitrospirae bacterium]|nr:MAG: hypothetical protein D6690_02370 [Nitrospirota bacterium]